MSAPRRDTYPIGAHVVEVRVHSEEGLDVLGPVLACLVEAVRAADPACRRVVFGRRARRRASCRRARWPGGEGLFAGVAPIQPPARRTCGAIGAGPDAAWASCRGGLIPELMSPRDDSPHHSISWSALRLGHGPTGSICAVPGGSSNADTFAAGQWRRAIRSAALATGEVVVRLPDSSARSAAR